MQTNDGSALALDDGVPSPYSVCARGITQGGSRAGHAGRRHRANWQQSWVPIQGWMDTCRPCTRGRRVGDDRKAKMLQSIPGPRSRPDRRCEVAGRGSAPSEKRPKRPLPSLHVAGAPPARPERRVPARCLFRLRLWCDRDEPSPSPGLNLANPCTPAARQRRYCMCLSFRVTLVPATCHAATALHIFQPQRMTSHVRNASPADKAAMRRRSPKHRPRSSLNPSASPWPSTLWAQCKAEDRRERITIEPLKTLACCRLS